MAYNDARQNDAADDDDREWWWGSHIVPTYASETAEPGDHCQHKHTHLNNQ